MVTIYAVVSLIDGKEYIGATRMNLDRRLMLHFKARMRRDSYIYRHMRHHVLKDYKIIKLEECDESVSTIRENYHIKKRNSLFPTGLNSVLAYGGQFTDAALLNKSKAQLKRFKSNREKNKHSNLMKKMFKNPEVKERHRMSLINSWDNERRREYALKYTKNKGLQEAKGYIEASKVLSKKVNVYCVDTKKVLVFNSATEAAKHIGSSVAGISASISKRRILLKKYILKYEDSPQSFDEIFDEIEKKKIDRFLRDSEVRSGRVAHNIKKVQLTNANTKEKLIFDSVQKAAEYLKRQTTNISYACKKKGRLVNGHYAVYLE